MSVKTVSILLIDDDEFFHETVKNSIPSDIEAHFILECFLRSDEYISSSANLDDESFDIAIVDHQLEDEVTSENSLLGIEKRHKVKFLFYVSGVINKATLNKNRPSSCERVHPFVKTDLNALKTLFENAFQKVFDEKNPPKHEIRLNVYSEIIETHPTPTEFDISKIKAVFGKSYLNDILKAANSSSDNVIKMEKFISDKSDLFFLIDDKLTLYIVVDSRKRGSLSLFPFVNNGSFQCKSNNRPIYFANGFKLPNDIYFGKIKITRNPAKLRTK